MATLLPATIAYAERMGCISGRELIAAVVVGIDVAAGLGVAAREGLKFFRPATSGGFGATAAIAQLARFDPWGTATRAEWRATGQRMLDHEVQLPRPV